MNISRWEKRIIQRGWVVKLELSEKRSKFEKKNMDLILNRLNLRPQIVIPWSLNLPGYLDDAMGHTQTTEGTNGA